MRFLGGKTKKVIYLNQQFPENKAFQLLIAISSIADFNRNM